ncbi:metallophosphoesterase family protein [Ulvibacter antarcticus]|uniref:Serine/threonine protein phosphatase 1 n=1 Tax=Ulvibacter antarcticus TaxID=442714 RepID=A0A3L9Z0T6_9FLAO|nr:metallophosphoesterase family protein [Ulvibacter antarcticus]RMA66124.1 serine/threonine protein phosphatase 1 [Ulvibacter antarcticus]
MARTYVVGDIHGGLHALKEVLDKVPFSSEDLFIFVGDYVDGWSDNAETIAFLLDFSEANNCIFLRGNHDELLYNFLKKGDKNPVWLASGGISSMYSYANLSEEEIQLHMHFLEKLENYHVDTKNRLFVHAGFTSIHGPQHEFYPRNVYWDRTLWEMAYSMDQSLRLGELQYPKRLSLFNEIFIGHTPVTRVGKSKPTNFANVWNVDTGAAFKGPLSILDAESKEIWQSKPVWTLYPEEMGRN